MAKDDYFVLAYRLLAYLYACLKAGETPDQDYLRPGTGPFPVGEAYWNYLLLHLYEDGYLEGVRPVSFAGQPGKGVKLLPDLGITPKGIQFLAENSMMAKARSFLKELKEVVPGL